MAKNIAELNTAIESHKAAIVKLEGKIAGLQALEVVVGGTPVELTRRDGTVQRGVVVGVKENDRGVKYAKVMVGTGMDAEFISQAVQQLKVIEPETCEQVEQPTAEVESAEAVQEQDPLAV